jgi:hypothetical protein
MGLRWRPSILGKQLLKSRGHLSIARVNDFLAHAVVDQLADESLIRAVDAPMIANCCDHFAIRSENYLIADNVRDRDPRSLIINSRCHG